MPRNEKRIIVKLRSTAGTGYVYTTRKNKVNDRERLELKKYDPKIRRHVPFREGAVSADPPGSVIAVSGPLGVDTSAIVRSLLAGPGSPTSVLHDGHADHTNAHDVVCLEPDIAWADDTCACCGVRLDVHRYLTMLRRRSSRPTRAIIQSPSGSDQSLVAQTLLGIGTIACSWRLTTTIVVLDAFVLSTVLGATRRTTPPADVAEQLALADLVVVLGAGRLSAEGVQRVHGAVRRVNRYAEVLQSPSAHQLSAAVDGHPGFDIARARRRLAPIGHPSLSSDDEISSVWIEVPGQLDPERLEGWIHTLHDQPGTGLLRIEGQLAVDGEANRWLVRGVRRTLEIRDGEPWQPGEAGSSLIVTGIGLDAAAVRDDLTSCTV